jgi:hypothetical protein
MIFTLALTTILALVGPLADAPNEAQNSSAAATPANPAKTSEDPKITQRVRGEFAAWQRGALDRSAYSAATGEQLNDDTVDAMSDHLKPLGAVRSTTSLFNFKQAGSTIYVYLVHCENGTVRMKLGFDTAGKISAVSFEPEP